MRGMVKPAWGRRSHLTYQYLHVLCIGSAGMPTSVVVLMFWHQTVLENNIVWMPADSATRLFFFSFHFFYCLMKETGAQRVDSFFFSRCLLGPCPFRSLLLIRWRAGSPCALQQPASIFLYSPLLSSGCSPPSATSNERQDSPPPVCCLCLQAMQSMSTVHSANSWAVAVFFFFS